MPDMTISKWNEAVAYLALIQSWFRTTIFAPWRQAEQLQKESEPIPRGSQHPPLSSTSLVKHMLQGTFAATQQGVHGNDRASWLTSFKYS